MKSKFIGLLLGGLVVFQVGCQKASESHEYNGEGTQAINDEVEQSEDAASDDVADHVLNEQHAEGHSHFDGSTGYEIPNTWCSKASTAQKEYVYLGWTKKDEFLQRCAAETNNSSWCSQVVRPNPSSASTFGCTYGVNQAHNLIHPDEGTWKYPIAGIRILQDLSAKGIKISQIYNWWRPEPYNKNVGGAAGRHPYGTSIDVRFGSNSEADRAFAELCKMRRAGRLRAIGHYGSSSLHLGVGDRTANTWGKSCN